MSHEDNECFRKRHEEVGGFLQRTVLVWKSDDFQTIQSLLICLLLSSFWLELIMLGRKSYRASRSHEDNEDMKTVLEMR